MDDRKKGTTVPLRVGKIVLSGFFLIVLGRAFLGTANFKTSPGLSVFLGVYVLFFLVALLRSCVHYEISERYLVAKFLGIPFRFIPWEKIAEAQYVHAFKDVRLKYAVLMKGIIPNVGHSYETIIYVTLKGCLPYIPLYHIRIFHNIAHPFGAACIWLPYKSKDFFINSFRKQYPSLKIQPLDDWKKF